jgi:hypothetical protein
MILTHVPNSLNDTLYETRTNVPHNVSDHHLLMKHVDQVWRDMLMRNEAFGGMLPMDNFDHHHLSSLWAMIHDLLWLPLGERGGNIWLQHGGMCSP